MRASHRYALLTLAATAAVTLGGGGCSTPSGSTSNCTVTPFISPTTVTLDHTVAGNSVQFTTGYQYTGKGCAIPTVAPAYTWQLSDAIDASVTSAPGPTGTVTCNAAALNPITISTTIAGTTAGGITTYTPTGLPSATLICK